MSINGNILGTENFPVFKENPMVSIEYMINIANMSECIRRKYSSVIISYEGVVMSVGHNQRVGNCCNNGQCVRNRLNVRHGTNTDSGAEVHAEQAALINANLAYFTPKDIYVLGLDENGIILNGLQSSPCYSCARMVVFAGISWVYLPVDGEWERFSIDDIMENREKIWEQ